MLVAISLAGCAEERARAATDATGGIHPPGILDPTSEQFHGRELARRGYDFALCASCHGEDFGGGAAEVSCTSCHEDGPTACVTCHAPRDDSAPHAAHRAADVACDECHRVPATWDAPGHVLRDGDVDPSPAEVTFGARAALTLDAADRAGPPVYEAGRCSNVYCHGDALGDAGGTNPKPRWSDAVATGCGRCHGAPPPDHAQAQCATCHPAEAPHIDGAVAVGRTAGCDGCHGSGGDPAPPYDLDANELTTALGVGAHQAHVVGASRLRGPVPCAACHAVPSTVDAAGHIDTPRPAEVNTALGWQRAQATCTSAWCHGSATPAWTSHGTASCGTCHEVPPATPAHAGASSIATCAGCHPRVIDTFGNFVFSGGASAHIDGDVDVF